MTLRGLYGYGTARTRCGAAALAPSLRELLSVAKLRECLSLNGMAPGFV